MGLAVLILLGAIRVGAAEAAVTPSLSFFQPTYLAGFGTGRRAKGVHDPIFARAFVLDDGKTRVGVVSCDLVGLFYEPDVVAVREMLLRRGSQVRHLFVVCTHNHEGPDTLGLWGPSPEKTGLNTAYQKWLRERIVEVVLKAEERLSPAEALFSVVDHPYLRWAIEDSRPPLVYDHRLYLVSFRTLEGKPICTLLNWANHPESVGEENTLLSADYPGVIYRELAQAGGTVLFLPGAIGGLMTPLGDIKIEGKPAPPVGFERAEALGRMVAKLALEGFKKASPIRRPHVSVLRREVFVPVQNERFILALRLEVLRRPVYSQGRSVKSLPAGGEVEVKTEMAAMRLGEVIFSFAPGEVYPELVYGGIERFEGADFPDAPFEPPIKPRAEGRPFIFVGLANDELGYIIPKAEWDAVPPWLCGSEEETYGEVSSCGPEVARIVCETLGELVGKLAH